MGKHVLSHTTEMAEQQDASWCHLLYLVLHLPIFDG